MMMGTALVAAEGAAALEPVHSRQHEVDQRDVGRRLGEDVEALLAARRVPYLVPLAFEGEPHGGPDPLVVLDDQDATAHVPPATDPYLRRPDAAADHPKAGWPCGVVGLLKFCTLGLPTTAHTARSVHR